MPLPLLAAAGIAQGVGGLIKLFSGNSQKNQGQRLLDQIGDSPNEVVPEEVLQNQRMAQTRAKLGLPSEQYAQAMQNIQRQQLGQLKGANDRRGGLAALSGIGQGYNDSMLKLDVQNANARMNNEKTLYGINNQVGNWKDKIWGNNVRDKWNRKYSYGMSLKGMGNQNFMSGLNQTIAGAGQALIGIKSKNGGSSSSSSGGGDTSYMQATDQDNYNTGNYPG